MKLKVLFAFLAVILTGSVLPMNVFAQTHDSDISGPKQRPVTYVISPEGHRIPVYLTEHDPQLVDVALAADIITESDAERVNEFMETHSDFIVSSDPTTGDSDTINEDASKGSPWCPWGGSAATLISEGWDSDDDYYKDYEHPVGWDHYFICVTPFYYALKGAPAEEFHNDYKAGIARHRLKIGLSGSPGFFASAQAYMRWQ